MADSEVHIAADLIMRRKKRFWPPFMRLVWPDWTTQTAPQLDRHRDETREFWSGWTRIHPLGVKSPKSLGSVNKSWSLWVAAVSQRAFSPA